MKKMYGVLLSPLLLSGCMMLGMGGAGSAGGGMESASDRSSMAGPTLIKESVGNGVRITAEFPPYVLGDELVYKVSLRDARDESGIANASIALVVTRDDNRSQNTHSAQAGSPSGHGDSSATQSQGTARQMKLSPVQAGDGTYVFRPSITSEGAYRFTFLLQGVGGVPMDQPFVVEQTVQFRAPMDHHMGNGGHGTGFRMAPVAMLGAGMMAIMMVFAIR